MRNDGTSFNEFNYNRKLAKIKLYNSILAVMTRPMTIDDIIEIHQLSRKPSFYNPIIINMVRSGHIETTGKATFNRKIYQVINNTYSEPLGIKPAKKSEVIEPVIEGGRIIRLTDKVHHTKRTKIQRSAWIGSTMGMI